MRQSRHELGVEQQEQPREREEVNDQGEHAVEGIPQRDDSDRAPECADGASEECDLLHCVRILDTCATLRAPPCRRPVRPGVLARGLVVGGSWFGWGRGRAAGH